MCPLAINKITMVEPVFSATGLAAVFSCVVVVPWGALTFFLILSILRGFLQACRFLVQYGLLSGRLLGGGCSLGWPCVLFVFWLFVALVVSRFGFGGWI